MRVIAGSCRGRRLLAPRGLAVRPTAARLREALFSVLGERVDGARLWDVCAGTGAIGIEALSRGAHRVVFTEPMREARRALERNLSRLGLGERAEVHAVGWQRAVEAFAARGWIFDLIFFDPPYDQREDEAFLMAISDRLAPGGQAMIEHPRKAAPETAGSLVAGRILRAGDSAITFFSPRPDPDGGAIATG